MTVAMSSIEETPDAFCDFCVELCRILSSTDSDNVEKLPQRTYQGVLKSAEGCRLCHLIVESFPETTVEGSVRIQDSTPHEFTVLASFLPQYGQLVNDPSDHPEDSTSSFELFQHRGEMGIRCSKAKAEICSSFSRCGP